MKKSFVIPLLILSVNLSFSQELELPIFKEKLKYGIYKTFEEFKYNTPSIIDSFYVDLKERKSKNWEGTYSKKPKLGLLIR